MRKKSTLVKVHPSCFGVAQINFTFETTQFAVNLNDTTGGHKFQEISKDKSVMPVFPSKTLCATWIDNEELTMFNS